MNPRPLFIAAYVAVSGGILGAAWKAPQWRWQGRYVISGTRTVPASQLERALPHPLGKPLFLIDPQQIRKSARAFDPSIKDARVRRWLFPPTLSVRVIERQPTAIVDGPAPKPGLSRCLDADGEDFLCKAPALALKVRVRAVPMNDAERTAFMALAAAWLPGATGTVDMRDPASWSAQVLLEPASTQDAPAKVILGTSDDLKAKFRAFRQVLPLTKVGQKTLEYVDVRFPDAPAFKVAGDPLSPIRTPGTRNEHGQGLAGSGHRHRADGGHPAGHAIQEPGRLRQAGSSQPAGRRPGGDAQGH